MQYTLFGQKGEVNVNKLRNQKNNRLEQKKNHCSSLMSAKVAHPGSPLLTAG